MARPTDLVLLPPNRVHRGYTGGRTLDRIAGRSNPDDSHLAEDWIASTTLARNPGQPRPREGISRVSFAGQDCDFAELLHRDPDYFLGADHVARFGTTPMLLVKYLDSATRLHFQCHPSREFARRHLNSSVGKTEAYHILGIRSEVRDPYIYVGFQRPPSPDDLRRWIEQQDIAALEACFDRIPVAVGETYLIPAGVPHALGEGIFMVEVQEPSDLVARIEYARAGHLLPEPERFMGRDLEFTLSFMDQSAYPLHAGRSVFCCEPVGVAESGSGQISETLIGPDQTDCFELNRITLRGESESCHDRGAICIVTRGAVEVRGATHTHRFERYQAFFRPARIGALHYRPHGKVEILECLPPAP